MICSSSMVGSNVAGQIGRVGIEAGGVFVAGWYAAGREIWCSALGAPRAPPLIATRDDIISTSVLLFIGLGIAQSSSALCSCCAITQDSSH